MKTQKVRFMVEEFPQGTTKIYITGSSEKLGNWDPEKAVPMQYYQNEGTEESFFADVTLDAGEVVEYKYLNFKSWDTVECGVIAQEIPNRTITIKDDGGRRLVRDKIKGFRIPISEN